MPKTTKDLHPAIRSARRAIVRALPELKDVQLFRLAVTAEMLAWGDDIGRWSASVKWAEQERMERYTGTTKRLTRTGRKGA